MIVSMVFMEQIAKITTVFRFLFLILVYVLEKDHVYIQMNVYVQLVGWDHLVKYSIASKKTIAQIMDFVLDQTTVSATVDGLGVHAQFQYVMVSMQHNQTFAVAKELVFLRMFAHVKLITWEAIANIQYVQEKIARIHWFVAQEELVLLVIHVHANLVMLVQIVS